MTRIVNICEENTYINDPIGGIYYDKISENR